MQYIHIRTYCSVTLQQQKALLSQCDCCMMVNCCHYMMNLTVKGIVGVTFCKSLGIAVCVVSYPFYPFGLSFSVCLLCLQGSVSLFVTTTMKCQIKQFKSATTTECRLSSRSCHQRVNICTEMYY